MPEKILKVGIIAEGTTDQAVLIHILKGALNVQREEIQFIRPALKLDKTDFNNLKQLGGWESVKRECETGEDIKKFFKSELEDEQCILIIQLDTAEYQHAHKKDDTAHYCLSLRDEIITLIKNWLSIPYPDSFYAICIEEMDAWILTLYQQRDSVTSANPKEKLRKELKGNYKEGDSKCYELMSKEFRKSKNLTACCEYNESLRLFVESLSILKEENL